MLLILIRYDHKKKILHKIQILDIKTLFLMRNNTKNQWLAREINKIKKEFKQKHQLQINQKSQLRNEKSAN